MHNSTLPYHKSINGAVTLILLAVVLTVVFLTTPFTIIDDAYISFRYAHNLAHSGELVFNPGERVEGITNLLWTLILGTSAAIFPVSMESFVLFLSLSLLAFVSLRLWQLGPLLGTSPFAGTLAALLLILNPDFILTSTNGLEVPLFSALLVEIIYRYTRNQLALAFICAGLLFMTRPEGAALGFLLIGLVCMEQRSLRKGAIGLVLVGGFVLAVTAFRLLYYGTPLPNSVIAKSFALQFLPGLRGPILSFMGSFAVANPCLVILFLGGLLSLRSLCPPQEKASFILLFCVGGVIASFIVMIRNGGDWMPYHRLVLQYGVLYAVILIVLLRKTPFRFSIAFVLIAWLFLQTAYTIATHSANPLSIRYRNYKSGFYADTTRRLSTVLEDSDTISAEGLGYISYYLLRNRFHDPAGLTDPHLARYGKPAFTFGKVDEAYTVGTVRPSVMVWHYAGHLKGLEQNLLDNYETFCAADCDNWKADVVMIRKDRLDDLAPAFADLQKIKIETERIRAE
jgi:hypothetical protein